MLLFDFEDSSSYEGMKEALFLELYNTVFLLFVEKKIILMPGGEFYIRPDIGIKL